MTAYGIVFVVFISRALFVIADIPCSTLSFTNQSVVCVCNATYCDTITRQPPVPGHFTAYYSSKAGLRFARSSSLLRPVKRGRSADLTDEDSETTYTIELDPTKEYQTIEGFGGAVTDSASLNWQSLPPKQRQYLMDSYFSSNGIEYSMIRVPIGGCDFSTHPYAYNELPINDMYLRNFSLSPEDYNLKIPMLKAAQCSAGDTIIDIVASTWAPPNWMKHNPDGSPNNYTGRSNLKPEYYDTYALYHVKFLREYAKQKIRIWGITTTNEPADGEVVDSITINEMGWSAKNLAKYIRNNLGPQIRNSEFRDVKILLGDDQRTTIPYYFTKMIKDSPGVLDWIDGFALHFYSDTLVPATYLDVITETSPELIVLNTEASQGVMSGIILGSWDRAVTYIKDIIEDLNHNVAGWIEWNLCLDKDGGPNWAQSGIDSPIIVFPESGTFYKQPMFYAIGHFSKFIPRGSIRIDLDVILDKPTLFSTLRTVAFLRPDKQSVVVVVYNDVAFPGAGFTDTVAIRLGDHQAVVKLEPEEIATVEIPYSPDCSK